MATLEKKLEKDSRRVFVVGYLPLPPDEEIIGKWLNLLQNRGGRKHLLPHPSRKLSDLKNPLFEVAEWLMRRWFDPTAVIPVFNDTLVVGMTLENLLESFGKIIAERCWFDFPLYIATLPGRYNKREMPLAKAMIERLRERKEYIILRDSRGNTVEMNLYEVIQQLANGGKVIEAPSNVYEIDETPLKIRIDGRYYQAVFYPDKALFYCIKEIGPRKAVDLIEGMKIKVRGSMGAHDIFYLLKYGLVVKGEVEEGILYLHTGRKLLMLSDEGIITSHTIVEKLGFCIPVDERTEARVRKIVQRRGLQLASFPCSARERESNKLHD